MFSLFIRVFFFWAIFISLPLFAFAQTSSTALDLQALVQQLEAQVKALQAQVMSLQEELLLAAKQPAENLHRGSTGDEVRKLQEFLKQFPDIYPEGLVTGYFGPLTEAAVGRFQEKKLVSIPTTLPMTFTSTTPPILSTTTSIVPTSTLVATTTQPASTSTESVVTPAPAPAPAPTPASPPPPATEAPPSTTAAPTTSSSTTTATPSIGTVNAAGVCLVRNSDEEYTGWLPTNVIPEPLAPSPDLGVGYAKLTKPGVNTVLGLQGACTFGDYNALLTSYCASNSGPAKLGVETYDSQGKTISGGGFSWFKVSGSPPVACGTTITTNPDTTPPIISNIQVADITTSAATVSWSTNEPANTWLRSGTSTAYSRGDVYSLRVVRHQVKLSGLLSGTTYHYEARSGDPSGNYAISNDFTFTTVPEATTASSTSFYNPRENLASLLESLTSLLQGLQEFYR